MKHILVATDFSEAAEAALREAVELAVVSGSKITLLYVIYAEKINEALLGLDAIEHLARAADERGPYEPGQAIERLRDAAQEKLDEAIAKLPGPRPPIESAIAEGRPSVQIVEFAEAHGVDLIIVGTHGRSALGKAFLGSVADHVIRQADCPVMVVRK